MKTLESPLQYGQVIEVDGRLFRVRYPDEVVQPTDYHSGHNATIFTPNVTCSQVSYDAYDKKEYKHLEEVDALTASVLEVRQRLKKSK